ncbi:MAG: VWA domain-containing protein [Steroidobacteraceae bacterium]|nr:VWA domain-containing protein [Steroidobacteraceae bacterium]
MAARQLALLMAALAWFADALGEPTIDAPASAGVGSEVAVTVGGTGNPLDFVTIVAKGGREGSYGGYQYVRKPGTFKLTAPATPGDYEVRVLGAASPYPTLARRPIRIDAVAATLEAPEQVAAGAKFQVKWSGPDNPRDYVGIGNAARPYVSYVYAKAGNPASLTAPDDAGEYELRYFLGEKNTVIGTRRIIVGGVTATVSAPAQVAAGAKFAVAWTGPDNARDFVTLVKAGTPENRYERYAYTSKGSPLQLTAPDEPGDYELRYLTAQSYATLGRAPVKVTPISASIEGPAEAVAGSTFAVKWQGPNNVHDYVTVLPKGAREGESGNYRYTAQGNPAKVLAPLAPGDYELRYSTGQSHATLARAAIHITPGKLEPGFVAVTVAQGPAAGNAVEIILDASGSMLQKIGKERRIDIAKKTLTHLTSSGIPAGTPLALRVFGREVDSCQTDLDIALGPLNAVAVAATIARLEAKNGAKTPIGASLDKVADDLRGVRGERLVILLTDGEETCGGDPAAAIEKLRKAGAAVRVNIVGFAIDDQKLAATFRHWSDSGGGLYFDARDAASLDQALTRALQPAVELVDGNGQVVAEGLAGDETPLSAIPGNYTIRLKGRSDESKPVQVQPKATTTVAL